jgi:hypothetical protein
MASTIRPSTAVIARVALVAFVALAALPAAARAQAGAVQARPPQILSVNPFGLVFNYFYAEYERAFTPNSSGAISGSYSDLADDLRFVSFDLRYRLYPSENAPEGFSVAATVGFSRVTDTGVRCSDGTEGGCEPGEVHPIGNALTTGIQLDYTWLLGSRKGFAIGVGLGAKRLRYTGDEPGDDPPKTVPTARFTIGRAF